MGAVHAANRGVAVKRLAATVTGLDLTKRQRELLEEFEQLSSKENSPQSSGFFSRMKDFFEAFGER